MSITSLSAHAGAAWQLPWSYARVSSAWQPVRGIFSHSGGAWQTIYGWPFTMTAATFLTNDTGWQYNQAGSINGSPASGTLVNLPVSGHFLYGLYVNSVTGDLNLILSRSSGSYVQSDILALVTAGQVFLGSSAVFSGTSPATWSWSGQTGLYVSGNTYNCSVVGPGVTG